MELLVTGMCCCELQVRLVSVDRNASVARAASVPPTAAVLASVVAARTATPAAARPSSD